MSDEQTPLTNPMVVTLDYYEKLIRNFQIHYYLNGCNSKFGGQEIQVSWNSFSLAIYNFMSANNVTPECVAIRFVHCYDVAQTSLYLRMQILTMKRGRFIPQIFTLVDTPCDWYELSNGTITPTTNTDLFDQAYFDNFYYCDTPQNCSAQTLESLALDTAGNIYTRMVTFPWLELSELYDDNNDPSNAILCLDACARLNIIDPEVKFQHGLVMYLRNADGEPILDNTKTGELFCGKAADFGTMCPPYCNIYILPKL